MSAMRLCFVAAIIAAGLVAAQTPRLSGCTTATGIYGLYENATSVCTQMTACTTGYTSCIAAGTSGNCTLAAICIGLRLTCLNVASDNATGCHALNGVRNSLLTVAAGTLYNASDAYKSCVATACHWLNASFSGVGTNCTIDSKIMCKSPIVYVATILFRGNFTAILADSVKRAKFADAIAADLAKALGISDVHVRRMFIAGSRRQAEQTLVVEVEAPGVSAQNTAFKSKFDALAANPQAFFTSAAAVYSEVNPGQTLTLLKVGAGSSSAAFSKIPIPTTAAPTTKAPVTTTKAPTTTGGSGSDSGNPTTTGTATQSLLAAVAIAVVSALLF